MFTKQAAKKKLGAREGFRWRGEDISRIESLSDGVFAFAVTLLIVSTEVPKTFDEFILKLRDFVPFAACFVQLMSVWYLHYTFYRRYNLQDMKSMVLTMTLLFLVLLYTYPLKFVYLSWWLSMISQQEVQTMFSSPEQIRQMFEIYALGFIAVFAIFVLMYDHAYRSRLKLGLTELEIWDTLHVRREMLLFCEVGILSLILAMTLPVEIVFLSAVSFSLLGVVTSIHGGWSGKRRREIHSRLFSASEPM
jgi:uncharacterized membrane protein